MPLESSATYISDLVATNPPGTDQRLQGDDHIRLTKDVLQNTFPNASRAFYFERVLAKSASYTVLAADDRTLIVADASSAAITITLPASTDGFVIGVLRTNSGANKVTIDGDGTEIVDLDETYELLVEGHVLWLIGDGTKWHKFHEWRRTIREIFSASTTWTRPKGVKWATAQAVGCGGGGGGGSGSLPGGGGGGGGVARGTVDVSGSATHSVSVGAGGAGGTGTGAGSTGGNCSFSSGGNVVQGEGGVGGTGSGSGLGGSGGGTTIGSGVVDKYSIVGGNGGTKGSNLVSGYGGSSALSNSMRGVLTGNGVAGLTWGGGGSGAGPTVSTGGTGAIGVVIIEY